MKTKSILILLFAISIAFTSCKKNESFVTPSGNITTVKSSVTGFTKLDVSDPFNVFVTFSDTEESVEIEANSNLQGYIRVLKNQNSLVVELDDKINIRHNEATLNIHITMKNLDRVEGAGATSFQLKNEMTGNSLEVELTGACSFAGNLSVEQVNATLEGSSKMNISGSASSLKLDANGASKLESYGFQTNSLDADLSGASNVYTTVNEKMDVKASGASTVYYKGDAYINSQNLSDASQIMKVE